MAELCAELNTRNLLLALRAFPEELKYELYDAFDHISKKFLIVFRETRLKGPPGILGRPHGIFTYFKRVCIVSKDLGGIGMIIYTESVIARMHEEGAVIRQTGGRKMAVPLSARTEMFKGGEYPGRLKKRFKEPGLIKKMFRIIIRGKSYLAKRKRGEEKPKAYFVLKNQIRIKKRLLFYYTWHSMDRVRIQILNQSLIKALNTI